MKEAVLLIAVVSDFCRCHSSEVTNKFVPITETLCEFEISLSNPEHSGKSILWTEIHNYVYEREDANDKI